MRMLPSMILFSLLVIAPLRAFEAVGIIESVDLDAGVLHVQANGQTHAPHIAPHVEVIGTNGVPLPAGLQSPEIKPGIEVTLTLQPDPAVGPTVLTIRLGRALHDHANPGNAQAPSPPRASVGFKPLNDMLDKDRYKGEEGGLYGGGLNNPPAAHLETARQATACIQPLDAEGHPSPDGKIGLISISMSNATMEFSRFKRLADQDSRKSPKVIIVDCAQGGQAMAQWADPQGRPWNEAFRRLASSGVSTLQVQVAWIKLANVHPTGDLAEHTRQLQQDTRQVLHRAHVQFPNLRIAYLGSRIYGGYALSALNPEPYAYEGAFAVRRLILDQIAGDPALACVGKDVQVPVLLWGPYFWADGVTPRISDGLTWTREDLGNDGTHPSESGCRKVADMLLMFFVSDPLAGTWFTTSTQHAL